MIVDKNGGDCFRRVKFIIEFGEEVSEKECYRRIERLELEIGGLLIFRINGNYLYYIEKEKKNKAEKRNKWEIEMDLRKYGFDYIPLCALKYHDVRFLITKDINVKMEVIYENMEDEEKERLKNSVFNQDVKLPEAVILINFIEIFVPNIVDNSLYFYIESENMATFCKDGNELLSTYYGDGIYNVEVNGDCFIDIMGVNNCRVEKYFLRKYEYRVWRGMGFLI